MVEDEVQVNILQIMSNRIYIVPIIGAGIKGDPRRPKYISALALDFTAQDYGVEAVMVVACDTSDSQHTSIVANPDVIPLNDNLDDPISLVNLSALKTGLNTLRIPAAWLDTTISHRRLGRFILALFALFQRLQGAGINTFGGVTLSTKINQLAANVRNALNDAAVGLGFDTSGITGNMTLGEALKLLADQSGPREIGGITL